MEFKASYGISELPPRELMEAATGEWAHFFKEQARRAPARGRMSGKPYRLPQGGRLIDRTQEVRFTFDGEPHDRLRRRHARLRGDGQGQRLFGRSFKYHRPRGVVGLGCGRDERAGRRRRRRAPRAQSARHPGRAL